MHSMLQLLQQNASLYPPPIVIYIYTNVYITFVQILKLSYAVNKQFAQTIRLCNK
jgi:hypothetical protein